MKGQMKTANTLYAEKMGIPRRTVQRLGGAAKLKALDNNARNVLLGPYRPKRKEVAK